MTIDPNMKQINHLTLSLSATYLSLSTYDNDLDIHDESGDKLTVKGLNPEQLDSLCATWIKDRLRKDQSLKSDYPFSSLRERFAETAEV